MNDLFGLEQQPQRKNDRREAAALVEVLKALNTYPAVAWCERWGRCDLRPSAGAAAFSTVRQAQALSVHFSLCGN